MRIRRLFALLFSAALLSAQSVPVRSPLQAFIKYDQPLIALAHVRVIDGTGVPAKADQTLIIVNGKIQSMGDASNANIPAGAKILDLTGYTIIPGLVGMHNHMYYPAPLGPPALYNEHVTSFPRLYLAGGVTTIRTTGSVETYTDLEIKRSIDEGKIPGPKMHITGPYLEGQGAFTPQMHQLKDAEDARKTVEYWADQGVTSFKAYMHITRAELKAAIDAAHARKIKVTGHLCSIGFREAAALGINNLEHGILVDTEFLPDKKPDQCPDQTKVREVLAHIDIQGEAVQAMIRDLVQHQVAVTSTLPVFETFVPNRAPLQPRILEAMLPQAQVAYLRERSRISDSAGRSLWPTLFKKELEFEYAFAKAGGLLLAGLDPTGYGGVIPGYSDQRQVQLLVEAGFTPVEAIHIATANGAQFLGELDRIGTLAPGKQADIVVIKGDPSTNISDIENVETVFKDGVGYDSAKLADSAKGMVGLR